MKQRLKLLMAPVLLLAFACVPKPLRLPADLVWPIPPDLPRIQYVESFYGSDYFAPKWSHAIVDFLAGAEPAKHLVKPLGVAADQAGNVYISDGPGYIMVLDRAAQKTRYIANSGQARLGGPGGLTFSNEYNQVIAADPIKKRVLGIDPQSGKMVREISGKFDRPVAVAVDEVRDLLAVADSQLHQVKLFSLKDNTPVITLGQHGGADGEFNYPIAVAFDRRGHLFVSDSMNFRVQEFDASFTFVQSIGEMGIGSGQFARPKGIAIDSDGHLYVVDAAFGNVQIFDSEYGDNLLSFGGGGYGPGEFWVPNGMFIDDQDQIYIVDQVNRRVQIFRYLSEDRAKALAAQRKPN